MYKLERWDKKEKKKNEVFSIETSGWGMKKKRKKKKEREKRERKSAVNQKGNRNKVAWFRRPPGSHTPAVNRRFSRMRDASPPPAISVSARTSADKTEGEFNATVNRTINKNKNDTEGRRHG